MSAFTKLRAAWLLAPAASAFACERPDWSLSDTVPVATAGSSSSAGTGVVDEACTIDGSVGPSPVFSPYTVFSTSPARRDLYAYVTDAEAAELRRSRRLLASPSPATPVDQSRVQQQLSRLLANASDAQRPLFQELDRRFGMGRRPVWPNLFALRLLEHPGTEHMNPVHVQLRPEAWVGRMYDGSLSVVDVKNQLVTFEQAAANPERIAAIYVVTTPSLLPGVSCERGARELELASEAMVQSFSLGTQALLERMEGEIASLTKLFEIVRPCGSVARGNTTFQGYTACTTWSTFGAVTEYTAYGWSLAEPAEIYKPSPQNLVSLIDALDNDRFEVAPFVVEPLLDDDGSGGARSDDGAGAGAGGAP